MLPTRLNYILDFFEYFPQAHLDLHSELNYLLHVNSWTYSHSEVMNRYSYQRKSLYRFQIYSEDYF